MTDIKNIFGDFLLDLYIVILRHYLGWILKCEMRLASAVFLKGYIKAFDLFPEKNLKYYSDAAHLVKKRIFDYPVSDNDPDVENENVNALFDSVMLDEWVRATVSKYHLVDALYYSSGIFTDLHKEKSEEALLKAKKVNPSAQPIDAKAGASINKEIKRDVKILKREIKKLNTVKVDREKIKLIGCPITLKGQHLAFAASIFSSLFLISGYAYNKIFFSYFNIDVGDFFSAADYISSSVDVIVAAIISTVFGVLFFLWGLSGSLSMHLHEEQFEMERKKVDYLVPLIVVLCSVALVLTVIKTGEIPVLYLYPIILFLIFELVPRIPLWKYIHNKESVGAAIISIAIFSLHLGILIHDRIADIKSGHYSGQYVLQFKDEYKGHIGSEFISANNGYIFIWNKASASINIIPKEGVSEFRAK